MRAAKDAVVWLAVETEMEKNRAVVEKFPVDGLPTFLVIDPDTEQVIGKWLGSSSVNEMRQFVLDTAAAWQTTRKGGKLSPAAEAEREGHTAQQAGDRQAAATAYRKAVSLTDKKDPRRPERLALLVSALGGLGTPAAAKECVELARRELATMPASPPGADFSINAADCAAERKGDPQAQALLTSAMTRMEQLAGDTKAALSVDDRSDLYAHLAEHLDALKRHDEAVVAMRKRSAMLEGAAKAAPDAVTAATFDAHRTDTYLYLGEAPKAEAMLSAREKEMPDRLQSARPAGAGASRGEAGARGRGRGGPRAGQDAAGTAQGRHPRAEGEDPRRAGEGQDAGAPRAACSARQPSEDGGAAGDPEEDRGRPEGCRGDAGQALAVLRVRPRDDTSRERPSGDSGARKLAQVQSLSWHTR